MLVSFSDSEELIMLNSLVITIRDAIYQRRALNPNAGVCFHEMAAETASVVTGAFKLVTKQRVVAVIGKSSTEAAENDNGEGGDQPQGSQANAACCIPVDAWPNLLEGFKVLWSMRWTAAGLMPVRPQVVLLTQLTIPEGCSAMVLKGAR